MQDLRPKTQTASLPVWVGSLQLAVYSRQSSVGSRQSAVVGSLQLASLHVWQAAIEGNLFGAAEK